MIGSMSKSTDVIPRGTFCAALLDRFRNNRWIRLKVFSTCALLCVAGEAQARSCAILYDEIKAEAMYCGFFCDLKKLQLSQEIYEAACIRIVLPLSLFDIDSTSQELTSLAGGGDLPERTAILEADGLGRWLAVDGAPAPQ